MSGTFSSFNTTLGALNYNRILMDVASSNMANATTPGYVRRRVDGETVGTIGQAAMYARPQTPAVGEGVKASNVSRVSDQFLDARSRFEHGTNSYLRTRAESLYRLETGVGEPGDNGVSAALDTFRAGWHDLANSPDAAAARSQIVDRGTLLAEAINAQHANVAQEESDQRIRLDVMVTEVNNLTSDLAETNRAITVASFSGTDPNLLLDQRDQLAQRLAQLTGGTATLRTDGGFDVAVNGVQLVNGATANTLSVSTAADGTVSFQTTIDGVPTATGITVGEIGASADLINVDLPDYRAGLDAVVRSLADLVNAQHTAGFDQDGAAGLDFFTFDPANPSGTIRVGLTDPRQVAASGLPGGGFDGSNATALANTGAAENAYQQLVNSLGSTVASAERLAGNQQALTDQVDNSREAMSGVSTDEELVNLVAAQRSYEAVSRVMTALDQMLETLINRTGVVGR